MTSPSEGGREYRLQLAIVVAMITLFVALAANAPSDERVKLLVSGTVIFAASTILSRALESGSAAGKEILPVFLLSGLGLFMPLAASAPISKVAGVAALLGLLVSESLWAIHRYSAQQVTLTESIGKRVWRGTKLGLVMALVFSVVATVIVAIGLFVRPGEASVALRVWLLVLAGYVTGGLTAGALVGALQPLLAWPLGVMLAGILGGFLVYGAIMPAIVLIDAMQGGDARTLGVVVPAICGLAAGPPAALGVKYS